MTSLGIGYLKIEISNDYFSMTKLCEGELSRLKTDCLVENVASLRALVDKSIQHPQHQ